MSLIYMARCSKCGEQLEIPEMRLDRDFDLHIEVTPCEGCHKPEPAAEDKPKE